MSRVLEAGVMEEERSLDENAILKGASLSKVYRNGAKEVRALDGVSIRLAKGDFIAVVGPSGAGKSTLLHLLGGLDRPTGGKVMLNGLDLYTISEAKRAHIRNEKIGFVFQFYHLLPEFTAVENVMLPALIKRTTNHESRTTRHRAQALLETMGLRDRMDHRPNELSGGESQRVAIARALINDPDILLCDEPTGNLDSKTGTCLTELLIDINRRKDVSLIIATHDESISSMADRVVHIKDGKVVS
jgi:lipoprotein-releasing system ATP-binding protein